MNFYFVLFVVLGISLPREVSSQGNCSVPGDEDFRTRSFDCNNTQGEGYVKDSSECYDLNYTQSGPLPPSSKDPGHYILFVILDCLPVLILVPLILFFNINLASGTGHSIVFSIQVLLAIYSMDSIVLSRFYCYTDPWAMMVTGFLVFFNTPLMLFWYPLTLAHIALGYVKVVLAVVIVVVYLRVATASQCSVQCCRGCWARLRRGMRHWREAHLAQRPLFTGACSVAILIYGSLLDVSFRLGLGGYHVASVCTVYIPEIWDSYKTVCHYHYYTVSNPAICWYSSEHRRYLIPASVIVILALLPVLLFFYHPGIPALVSFITKGRLQLPRLHKIIPVLDVFQGVYRPKMQFFAGLHLLHRVVLWFTIAFYSNDSSLFLSYWLIILGIHSVFMPFQSYRHNYLESLIMISTAMTAFQSIQTLTHPVNIPPALLFIKETIYLLALFALPNLPLVCVIVYYVHKLVRLCCCRRRQNYQEIPEVQEDIEESFQGERWQPPDQAQLN